MKRLARFGIGSVIAYVAFIGAAVLEIDREFRRMRREMKGL